MAGAHHWRWRVVVAILALAFMRPVGQAAQVLSILLVKEDLGTLPGDTASYAYGINASRQIVGNSFGPGANTAYIWTPPGPMVALGAPDGVSLDFATDINDAGQVVGTGFGLEFALDAYIWTAPDDVVNLGNVGLFDEQATAINSLGWVTGYGEVPPYAPTLWVPPGPNQIIPGTAGVYGGASDVNDAGQVVGGTQLWSPGVSQPFYWSQADGLIALEGLPAGDGSGYADSINSGGAIAGHTSDGGNARAVVWPSFNANPVDLGTLGGSTASARAINNNGVVVGNSATANVDTTHAFRKSPGSAMQDLGTLGGTNSSAEAVNSAGHAVGTAQVANGQTHAVAWWRYTAASSLACNCQQWPPAPTWPGTKVIAVLIPGSPKLSVRAVDANTLTLGDGDGDDAPVAVDSHGRKLVVGGDFNRDGYPDLLAGFDPRRVAATTARDSAVWLVGAFRDRSIGIFGAVKR